jgi:cobalt/nickel transport system permease protein
VIAALISSVIGLQLGAFSVVLQTFLSGRSELPFRTFLLLMQPIHFAIGLVEGVVTAGVINFVRVARPEILEYAPSARPLAPGVSVRKILAGLLAAALITGGAMSWFASAHPDGLEWSVEKIFGKPELPEKGDGITPALKSVQEKTALLPDYDFRKPESAAGDAQAPTKEEGSWPAVEAGKSVSGIAGSVIVLAAVLILGLLIKAIRRKKTA